MRKAYISAPFRADTKEEIEKNIALAEEYGRMISMMVDTMDAVVVHTMIRDKWGIEVANVHGGPVDEEIIKFNLDILRDCDIIYICGDRVTVGMQGEMDEGVRLGKPVVRVQSDWLEDARRVAHRLQP